MALNPLAPSDAGASARDKINAAIREAEKVAGKADAAAVAALQNSLTGLAATLDQSAKDFTASLTRPGDGALAFALVTSVAALGGPYRQLPTVPPGLIAVGDNGRVVRLVAPAIVGMLRAVAIEPSRAYRVRAAVRRRANSADPSNDTVRIAVAWLDQAGNAMPSVAPSVVADLTLLNVADGRRLIDASIATAAGPNVEIVKPAGAVYARAYVQSFSSTGLTDVEVIDIADVTDATLLDPVSADALNRIGAIESANLPPRIDQIEAAIGNPNSLTFPTRSDAIAATIPANVTVVILRGLTAAGDGRGRQYKRVTSLPNPLYGPEQGFTSADGANWLRIEKLIAARDLTDDAVPGFQPAGGVAADLAAAVASNFASGGYMTTVAPGDYARAQPLVMRRGVKLCGQGAVPPRDTPDAGKGEVFMRGSTLRATANMDRMIGQFEEGKLQHSNTLADMAIDAGRTAYGGNPAVSVAAAIQMSPVNGRFYDNRIENGTGLGLYLKAPGDYTQGAEPSWVNWVVGNDIERFAYPLFVECTDSVIAFNYLSEGSASSYFHRSFGGLRHIGNQIELAAGFGATIEGSPYGNGSGSLFLGNYSNLNNGDWLVQVNGSRDQFEQQKNWHLWVGNISNVTAGDAFRIKGHIEGGMIACQVSHLVNERDVNWIDGVANPGWYVFGLHSDKPWNLRFANLPPDCDVLSAGPGGSYNRLGSLIVSPPNVAQTVPDAALNVYGFDTVRNQAGVAARFGFARNQTGFDTALLIGNAGGNAPFLALADGETTQAISLDIKTPVSTPLRFMRNGTIQLLGLVGAPTGLPAGTVYVDGSKFLKIA